MSQLLPRQPTPVLEVPTVDRGVWRLADRAPKHFSLLVFYRGLHCPICNPYLRELDRRMSEFVALGTEPMAISTDSEERARQTVETWGLKSLTIGYDLDLEAARSWGLFISSGLGMTSAGLEEPDRFAEPGLFLVRPDGALYASSVQTMPFARPQFAEILKALEFVIGNDYPARGEVAEPA